MVDYYLAAIPRRDCEYTSVLYGEVLKNLLFVLEGRSIIERGVIASSTLTKDLFSETPTYEFTAEDDFTFLVGFDLTEVTPFDLRHRFDSLRMRALGGEEMWEFLRNPDNEYWSLAIGRVISNEGSWSYDDRTRLLKYAIDDFHEILRGGLELLLANDTGEVLHRITKNR